MPILAQEMLLHYLFMQWNLDNNLLLHDAKSHLEDPALTEEHKKWLCAYQKLWDLTK